MSGLEGTVQATVVSFCLAIAHERYWFFADHEALAVLLVKASVSCSFVAL
ncbi:hypothetical protein APV28_2770 [Comamonas testosteroni]|nr:hypothetical protein APV28_2770 [Comamonas testosteroni]